MKTHWSRERVGCTHDFFLACVTWLELSVRQTLCLPEVCEAVLVEQLLIFITLVMLVWQASCLVTSKCDELWKEIKKVHLNDSLKQVMRNQLFVKCPVQVVSIDRFSKKWPKSRRIVIWPKLYWYMAWKLHIPNLFHLSFTIILLSCTYFVLTFRLLTVRSRLHRGPKRGFCCFFSAV